MSGHLRFRFKDVGPVREADLTLGDLTVVAGRNNTGKTYLTYSVYGFLKGWTEWPHARDFFAGQAYAGLRREGPSLPDLGELTRAIREQGEARLQVDAEHLRAVRDQVLTELGRYFNIGYLPRVFSVRGGLGQARLGVGIDWPFPAASPPVKLATVDREVVSLQYCNGRMHALLEGSARRSPIIPTGMVGHLLFLLVCHQIPEVFLLSAERLGIALFYRELDFAKSQLVDYLQKMTTRERRADASPYMVIDKRSSRYALPIKDNIDFTRSIPDLRSRQGPLARRHRAFDAIEDMMCGRYKASENDITFESTDEGTDSFEIPLHLASSSARGLSDLYFFLKHLATENHLLIIDEPESHLDTANQVQLARLLARLVRFGVRVLITTHSDYVVKEINNLIMLGHLSSEADIARGDLGYRPGDGLPPGSVRAYVAENGTLEEAAVDRFGIEMPVFDETIDRINRVAHELAFATSRRTDAK